MNKTQLIDELSSRFEGNKKAATQALDAVVDTITRTVAKGEKVAITGFGVFEKIDKPARFARNPATGERVRVKKTSVPRFKAGTGFKDVVSGAKKLPKVAATTARERATKVAGGGRATGGAGERATAAATKATAEKSATKRTSTAKSAAQNASTPNSTTARKATPTAAAKKSAAARKTTPSATSPARRGAARTTAHRNARP